MTAKQKPKAKQKKEQPGKQTNREHDAKTGRFLPGNKAWLARSSAGPNPKFKTPEQLWGACCEYFEWIEANPLYEDKLVSFQGATKREPVRKMRAMTITGLCLFLDVSNKQWVVWKNSRADLSQIITRVEAIIYDQKFSGAAADLLNPNIIARELGLSEKSELTGKDGGPIETTNTSTDDLISRISSLASRNGTGQSTRRDH